MRRRGHCVGCLIAADCPGEDTPCQTRTCDGALVCGLDNVVDGVTAGPQVAGDCRTSVCDGAGAFRFDPDDTDVRVDNNPCTRDLCDNGSPSNPALAPGTACPGGVCDGQSRCVACLVNTDCGPIGPCATFTCGTDHTCTTNNVAAGTAILAQTIGDCRVVQCDGQGGQVTVAAPGDVVADSNSCTDDVCQGDTPAHPPNAAGTSCGGASVCDGAGNCGPAAVDGGASDAADAPAGDGAGGDAGAGGGCPSPYLFCDDFNDGDIVGWTPVEQTSSTPGTWTVLSETGHDGAPGFDLRGTGLNTSYHYDLPSVNAAGGPWMDQTVSVWVKPTVTALNSDNNKVGVCARVTTAAAGSGLTVGSAYCLFIRDGTATSGRLQISKKPTTDSLSGLLSTTTSGFPPATIPVWALDTWYKLTLQVSGSSTVVLTGYVNDVKLVTFTDVGTAVDGGTAVVPAGVPAVILRGATASYDDLRVSSP